VRYRVGLIGAGIGESLSPALHEREAERLGLEYAYELLDIEELGRAPEDVREMVREPGFDGFNVTHPCKQLVAEALDALSPEAEAIDAVNTVVRDGGRLVGHNTDSTGFRDAFARRLPGAATGRVVLLGAGGAGAAVGHGLRAGRLTVLDADEARARELADRLGADAAPLAELGALLAEADGLVHATPTGMAAYPGTAVDPELLRPELWVAEVVYMPIETQLLRDARARGCRTLDGAGMVALQAAGSLELITGVRPDRDRMLEHVGELIAAARQAA
jgi:shikimate dehydrogenase